MLSRYRLRRVAPTSPGRANPNDARGSGQRRDRHGSASAACVRPRPAHESCTHAGRSRHTGQPAGTSSAVGLSDWLRADGGRRGAHVWGWGGNPSAAFTVPAGLPPTLPTANHRRHVTSGRDLSACASTSTRPSPVLDEPAYAQGGTVACQSSLGAVKRAAYQLDAVYAAPERVTQPLKRAGLPDVLAEIVLLSPTLSALIPKESFVPLDTGGLG